MNVKMTTNLGSFTLALNEEKAPITVKNFIRYVEEGFYNGTIFHRVIPNFMIQGGGMDESMQQKPTHEEIKNESSNGLKNVRGSIAMARTSAPHSASSQFFINVTDNSFLDKANSPDGYGYAVFGEVTEGLDVVDAIKSVATGNHGFHQDVPKDTVIIESAEVVA